MDTYSRIIPDDDPRQPTCWLNYGKPITPDPDKPLGPTRLDEYLWPVAVDGNRVGFSLIAPPDRVLQGREAS